MGLEATSARMSHLARCLLREGKFLTPDDIIACYDAVTREQVLQLARDTFDFEHVSFSAVGRVAARRTTGRCCWPEPVRAGMYQAYQMAGLLQILQQPAFCHPERQQRIFFQPAPDSQKKIASSLALLRMTGGQKNVIPNPGEGSFPPAPGDREADGCGGGRNLLG